MDPLWSPNPQVFVVKHQTSRIHPGNFNIAPEIVPSQKERSSLPTIILVRAMLNFGPVDVFQTNITISIIRTNYHWRPQQRPAIFKLLKSSSIIVEMRVTQWCPKNHLKRPCKCNIMSPDSSQHPIFVWTGIRYGFWFIRFWTSAWNIFDTVVVSIGVLESCSALVYSMGGLRWCWWYIFSLLRI